MRKQKLVNVEKVSIYKKYEIMKVISLEMIVNSNANQYIQVE